MPGIGPWTAHGFLIIALDRPDVLLPGDLALRRAVERAYGFGPTFQPKKRWSRWQSAGGGPRGGLPVASEYE